MQKIKNYFDCLHFTESKIFKFGWIVQEANILFQSDNELIFRSNLWQKNSNFSERIVKKADLFVSIYNMGILKGHPLNQTHEPLVFWPNRCKCIFQEVQKSIIKFHPYIEYPPGSNKWIPDENQPPSVDERSFPVDEPVTEFALEGMYQDPIAWIDWEIHSVSFSLEIDPRDEKHILTGSEYSQLHSQSRKAEVW